MSTSACPLPCICSTYGKRLQCGELIVNSYKNKCKCLASASVAYLGLQKHTFVVCEQAKIGEDEVLAEYLRMKQLQDKRMLDFLPNFLKGILSFLIYTINTLILVCIFLLTVTLIKFIIRIPVVTQLCDKVLNFIVSCWISINSSNSDLFNSIKWDIRGLESIEYRDWYLVLSNHQSWADILVLQKVFNRKIPMLKFFLKKELIWVPVLGFAWWALDFPFMQRYSTQFLKKNPHLKGQDLKRTKKACEKFRTIPVSIMNFVEGTRYTKKKHDLQKSQYKHLLKPKAGGIAFVLGAMRGSIHQIINVTIVYPNGADSFWGFISGRVKHIVVTIDLIPVTQDITGDYFNDIAFRDRFCAWINHMWLEKDAEIERLLNP